MKIKFMNLQRFNDENPTGEQQQEPQQQQQQQEPPHSQQQTSETQTQQPFATFPDEASFHARLSREAEKQVSGMLEELGLGSKDELAQIVEAKKQADKEAMTEAERLQNELTQAKTQATEATERANKTAISSEARLKAVQLGVDPKRLSRFIKMVELEDITVDNNGLPDVEKIESRLQEILDEMPEFAKKKAPQQGAGEHFGGGSGEKLPLTLAQIKTMSKEEIAENIEEVRKVMGQSH